MGKNQHIVPVGVQWGVRGAGNSRLTSVHNTQSKAINIGREIAKNQQSELVIHNQKGQIRDKDSFGNDPCPPKDRVH
jgi:cytochrome b